MKSIPPQQQAPRTYLENQDIRCVTSPYPTSTSKTSSTAEGIITPVLSAEMKDVVLERLEKEIMSKLGGGSMCRSSGGGSKVNLSGKKRKRERTSTTTTSIQSTKDEVPMMGTAESVVRSRFIVGEYELHRFDMSTDYHCLACLCIAVVHHNSDLLMLHTQYNLMLILIW